MSEPDRDRVVVAPRGRNSRLILGLISGALICLLFALQLYQSRQNSLVRERIGQSYESRAHLDAVLSLLQDVETGQRGYLLTGNPAFLEPYVAAKYRLDPALRALQASFADAGYTFVVSEIQKASREKAAFAEHVIALRRGGNASRAVALVGQGSGQLTMNRIRELVAQLRESEREELSGLLQASSSRAWWGQPLSLGFQGLLLVLLAAAYFAHLANVRRLERTSMLAEESSVRQTAIFDAASDAMIVVSERGATETFNPAARGMFGFNDSEMVGKATTALFKGELHLPCVGSASAGAQTEGAIQRLKGICADGSDFDAEVSCSTVDLGNRVMTLLLVRDGTERARMEHMKSQFVSTVSHELRTPLTSIRGALVLLNHIIGTSLDPQPRQLLNMAKSNSERLSKLIDDILDVEKLSNTDLQFHFETIDLRNVVTRAEESNRTFASDRGVRLSVTLPNVPLNVDGDESRLLQALTNLLSNAAKFSPKDGLVSIHAEVHDGAARVSVADRGPGIPVEFRPQLFDRFTQARGSQQSSSAGTGLGLAISKSIVERHRGRIGYESFLGEGTLFWIELPLAALE